MRSGAFLQATRVVNLRWLNGCAPSIVWRRQNALVECNFVSNDSPNSLQHSFFYSGRKISPARRHSEISPAQEIAQKFPPLLSGFPLFPPLFPSSSLFSLSFALIYWRLRRQFPPLAPAAPGFPPISPCPQNFLRFSVAGLAGLKKTMMRSVKNPNTLSKQKQPLTTPRPVHSFFRPARPARPATEKWGKFWGQGEIGGNPGAAGARGGNWRRRRQ